MQFAALISKLLHKECLYVTENCPSCATLVDNRNSAAVSRVNVTASELLFLECQPS